jgi:hypothetical protein
VVQRLRSALPLALTIAGVGLVTGYAAVAGDGDPAIALTPCLIALVLWGIGSLPLRVPMLALLALSWVVEVAGDAFAMELVETPLRTLGTFLFERLSLTFSRDALIFRGFDVLLVLFAVVIVYRHTTRSQVDRVGWVEAPRPIRQFAVLVLFTLAWMTVSGLARGGSFRFALWQVTRHLYLPFVYLLMEEALRGAADAKAVGRIILGAGVFRAVEAIVLRQMYPSIEMFPHATTHHDSVLFATCVGILLALILERPTKRSVKICALLGPVYLWGMLANNRRLVWTEIAMVAIFFFLVTPWGRAKRFFARALVISLLPLLVYAAAGWNSKAGIFAPVQTIRSMFDSNVDGSTRWRDWENYDLIYTFRQNPLFGAGFGHPFVQATPLPDITRVYELEPYVPHNSVLGLWAFGGLFGFSLLWAIFPVGMFFTVRAYRWSRTPTERITALGAAAAQICYVLQGYGDLGFGTWGPVFTVATAYALVGKICVANGAWPVAIRRGDQAQPQIGGR